MSGISAIFGSRVNSPLAEESHVSRANNTMVKLVQAVAFSVFVLFAVALCAEPLIMFLAVPLLIPGIPLAVMVIYLLSRNRGSRDSFYSSSSSSFYATPAPSVSRSFFYQEPSRSSYSPRSYVRHESPRAPVGGGARTPLFGWGSAAASYGSGRATVPSAPVRSSFASHANVGGGGRSAFSSAPAGGGGRGVIPGSGGRTVF